MTEPADIDALMRQVKSLSSVVDELRAQWQAQRRARQVRPAEPTVLSATAMDERYRLAKGTASAAYYSGQVRGQVRPGRGPTGRVLLIEVADAEALWGSRYVVRSA
jgi:hypothetical protein